MSIKRSAESSSQQHCITTQQEQEDLQQYWYDHDGEWTLDNEHAWASRTFSATCYKFTIQNDPALRRQGPLYSFLENWQLHTMYNKSQKILLGLADRQPCVLLTGDDFMFTPPPVKDDKNDLFIYQPMEEDEQVCGDTTIGGIDEHRWMLYQPTLSPLHVVNGNEKEDDLATDEPAMVMTDPALVQWYQNGHDQENDDSSTITTTSSATSTWRQWFGQGIMFLSQRMVEVAYLVAELAEALATKQDAALCKGRSIVQLFRVWRVFFLGVETMMHQLFSLDALPLLKCPATF